MREVERLLDVKSDAPDWRKQMISAIAAWALDHPGARVDPPGVFPQYLKRMREAIFADKRPQVARLARDIVVLMRDEGSGLDAEPRRDAEATIQRPIPRFGYCETCASDAGSMLLRRRFAALIV